MAIYEHVHELIRNTPLLRLSTFSANPKVKVYAKLELINPAGGIKDRFGVYAVRKLLELGQIGPDSTLIEATAGNTGLGMALGLVGTGIKMIFVIPDKFSIEKQILLRSMGATIINTPEHEGIEGAVAKAESLLHGIPHGFALRQFENELNPLAHFTHTGPEIYDDLQGSLDYFIMGAGSGGTFSGISRYLKSQNPAIQSVLADPIGSTLGGGESGEYQIEGIGNHIIPHTLDTSLIDQVIKVSDAEAFAATRKLAQDTALFAGSSSGANLAAAYRLSESLSEGTIVTILADRGERYFSKHIYEKEL